MTYKKGQSGNPAGKPKGTRNKVTMRLEEMADGEAEGLFRKALDMAMAGDVTMMRVCLERVFPPRKDRPINFELPRLKTTKDASAAMLKILDDVSKGKLTPSEASEVSKILENFADTVRLSEMEARIAEMERQR